MRKLLQLKVYSFLSSRWGMTFCVVGLFVTLNAFFQILQLLISKDSFAMVSQQYSQNIGGHSYQHVMCADPIDIVYTWVNGTDPRHKKAVADYKRLIRDPNMKVCNSTQVPDKDNCYKDEDTASRFVDNEELRYSLRSIEKFAPWIRNVYLVTNGQVPSWINTEHPRLTVVSHSDIFTNLSHLPTFSSPSIEVHLHRIPGLSKKFIYLNDDVMFGRDVYPDDFYTQNSGQKVFLSWAVPNCADGCPPNWVGDGYCDLACNVSSCDFDAHDCDNYTGPATRGGSTNNNRWWGTGTNSNTGTTDNSQRYKNYCSKGCPDSWIGDKYCDRMCKNLECGFDAGDCGVEDIFGTMHGVQITNETHLINLPSGLASVYFNLTDIVGSSTITDGSHDNVELVRTATISQKFKIMALTFHRNITLQEVMLSITAENTTEAGNKTIIEKSFNITLDTIVIPSNETSADPTTAPGENPNNSNNNNNPTVPSQIATPTPESAGATTNIVGLEPIVQLPGDAAANQLSGGGGADPPDISPNNNNKDSPDSSNSIVSVEPLQSNSNISPNQNSGAQLPKTSTQSETIAKQEPSNSNSNQLTAQEGQTQPEVVARQPEVILDEKNEVLNKIEKDVGEKDLGVADLAEKDLGVADLIEKDLGVIDLSEKDVTLADKSEKDVILLDKSEKEVILAGKSEKAGEKQDQQTEATNPEDKQGPATDADKLNNNDHEWILPADVDEGAKDINERLQATNENNDGGVPSSIDDGAKNENVEQKFVLANPDAGDSSGALHKETDAKGEEKQNRDEGEAPKESEIQTKEKTADLPQEPESNLNTKQNENLQPIDDILVEGEGIEVVRPESAKNQPQKRSILSIQIYDDEDKGESVSSSASRQKEKDQQYEHEQRIKWMEMMAEKKKEELKQWEESKREMEENERRYNQNKELDKQLEESSPTAFPWEQDERRWKTYETKGGGRKLLDDFADSLKHVNKMYTQTFGPAARKVPAHMPHMIDKDVMEEMQNKWPNEWNATASHRLRSGQDMQYAFAYFYYLIHARVEYNLTNVWETELDMNKDGELDDNELRTLGIHIHGAPLKSPLFAELKERLVNTCLTLRAPDPAYERPTHDDAESSSSSSSSSSSIEVGVICPITITVVQNDNKTAEEIKKVFVKKTKYRHQIDGTDEVAFLMIGNNDTVVQGKLDGIRTKRQKFICLNDNMNHSNPETDAVVKVLHDLYTAIVPLPSSFELPPNVRNAYQYIEDIREAKNAAAQGRLYTILVAVAALVALVAGVLRCRSYRMRADRRVRERRARRLLLSGGVN